MFILGHLGIGSMLAKPVARKLPRKALLLGTILSDLIDKPIYYGLVLVTGKKGLELGLFSGTRTFGHTLLFFFILGSASIIYRSKFFAALMLGVASHLFLDNFFDAVAFHDGGEGLKALFWPFLGPQFPVFPFVGAKEHLLRIAHPVILWGEVAGLLLLGYDYFGLKRISRK